jgi:hypothetical protein
MSGTSTPRGGLTPTPPGGTDASSQQQAAAGPSPLTIGKRFVKQYYQVLSTTPDQIHRFYQPTSVLSDGEGSTPTDPVTFELAYEGSSEKLKDRFFVKDLQIRFEFEHGAIDAQQSVNGGLLLVVTGHVVYYPNASEDEDAAVDDPIRKGFVHTFFLNALAVGTKKSFYVHNDILRFLKNPAEVAASISESATALVSEPVPVPATSTTSSEPPAPEELEPEVKAPPTPPKTRQPPAEAPEAKAENATISEPEVVDEAPGGGVEETKEDFLPMEVAAVKPPPKDEKAGKKDKASSPSKEGGAAAADREGAKGDKGSPSKNKSQGKAAVVTDAGRKSPVPLSFPAPKPMPGSWASLVAAGGGSSGGGGGSAVKAAPPAASKPPTKPTSSAPGTAPADKAAASQQMPNDVKKESSSGPSNSGNNNASSTITAGGVPGSNHKMGNANNKFERGDRPPKRDPDCTLVIKNLADNTKEADVLGLFQPFAEQTKSRVVGITVAAHRGIAFVDYDSINPVNKAVELHQKEPMRLFGRVLEVDQKTAEQRARRAAQRGGGGNYRSGSPSNGGMNRGGGHGGRGGYRRRDGGGRGDRGGRGGRGGR